MIVTARPPRQPTSALASTVWPWRWTCRSHLRWVRNPQRGRVGQAARAPLARRQATHPAVVAFGEAGGDPSVPLPLGQPDPAGRASAARCGPGGRRLRPVWPTGSTPRWPERAPAPSPPGSRATRQLRGVGPRRLHRGRRQTGDPAGGAGRAGGGRLVAEPVDARPARPDGRCRGASRSTTPRSPWPPRRGSCDRLR